MNIFYKAGNSLKSRGGKWWVRKHLIRTDTGCHVHKAQLLPLNTVAKWRTLSRFTRKVQVRFSVSAPSSKIRCYPVQVANPGNGAACSSMRKTISYTTHCAEHHSPWPCHWGDVEGSNQLSWLLLGTVPPLYHDEPYFSFHCVSCYDWTVHPPCLWHDRLGVTVNGGLVGGALRPMQTYLQPSYASVCRV